MAPEFRFSRPARETPQWLRTRRAQAENKRSAHVKARAKDAEKKQRLANMERRAQPYDSQVREILGSAHRQALTLKERLIYSIRGVPYDDHYEWEISRLKKISTHTVAKPWYHDQHTAVSFDGKHFKVVAYENFTMGRQIADYLGQVTGLPIDLNLVVPTYESDTLLTGY